MAQAPTSGLIVAPGPPISSYQTLVLGLAAQHRLPAVYSSHEVVKNGGLASYGVDAIDSKSHEAGCFHTARVTSGCGQSR